MEEKKSRIESLIEWAKNNHGRHISQRVARKYFQDDMYFWAALSNARANNQVKCAGYSN